MFTTNLCVDKIGFVYIHCAETDVCLMCHIVGYEHSRLRMQDVRITFGFGGKTPLAIRSERPDVSQAVSLHAGVSGDASDDQLWRHSTRATQPS